MVTLATNWGAVDESLPNETQPKKRYSAKPVSVWQAIQNPAPMRQVIVEGLVRRGEVMNIIAGTKVGKSWLALRLAFSVASGRPFLGRRVARGRVLLLDNELHGETIQNRLATVAGAMGIAADGEHDLFEYLDLRGEKIGISDLSALLQRYKPRELTLVILDAKYRFFDGLEENSNSDQTTFHNEVDRLASQLDCVICLIHHATKGTQTGKTVTDIGSGGGAQSRTVDCHLVIRPHDESDDLQFWMRLSGRLQPVQPESIRWQFPLWTQAAGVEPVLKRDQTRADSRQIAKDREGLSTLSDVFGRRPGESITRYELKRDSGIGSERLDRY